MALFSPSKADRLLLCPASVLAPKLRTSEHATRGIALHTAARDWLCENKAVPATDVNFDIVRAYVEHVRSIVTDELLVEHVFSIEALTSEVGATGTADAVAIKDDCATVIDFKTGFYRISPDSAQLKLYALCLLAERPNLYYFTLTIVQPNVFHIPSHYYVTADDLRSWWASVQPTVAHVLALAADPRSVQLSDYRPGVACRFCDATASCLVLQRHIIQEVSPFLFNTSVTRSEAIIPPTDDRITSLYDSIPLIEQYCKTIKELALQQAQNGKLEGYQIVQRHSPRKWIDKSEAEYLLRDMAVSKISGILSPTQVEKRIDKEAWDRVKHLVTTETFPTIVKDYSTT